MKSPSVSKRLASELAELMARPDAFISDDILLIDDLGMDDLDAADLALGLEEFWPGRTWTEDVDLSLLFRLKTFKALVAYVEGRLAMTPLSKEPAV